MSKKQIIKVIISVLIAALTALGAAFGLSSCNVTRTITTRSEACPSRRRPLLPINGRTLRVAATFGAPISFRYRGSLCVTASFSMRRRFRWFWFG